MKKFLGGLGFAIKGIQSAIVSEFNLKVHFFVAIVVSIIGLVVGLSRMECIVIVLCFALVIASELLNTAIEKLVNLVSPEQNPKAGLIKDIAAGGVLVCAFAAAAVGLFIFIPKF